MRIVRIVGDIDESTYEKFSDALAELEAESDALVDLELVSGGGVSYAALAICGRIRASAAPIRCTTYGLCQSAAVLILAACSYRRISPECWVMVHQDSHKMNGSTKDLVQFGRQCELEEKQWSKLLAQYTEAPAHEWDKLAIAETYLDAHECFQLGLVDEILKPGSVGV